MIPMKPMIAYCNGKFAIEVLVDSDEKVYHNITGNHMVKMPFVTEDKYMLIDAANMQQLAGKLVMTEMIVKNLSKQVEDGYSSDYLEKYFKTRVVDVPNHEMILHIVEKYQKFLDITVMGKAGNTWYDRWTEMKKTETKGIDRDLAYNNLFVEFVNAK